jgi:hypothetical protein
MWQTERVRTSRDMFGTLFQQNNMAPIRLASKTRCMLERMIRFDF